MTIKRDPFALRNELKKQLKLCDIIVKSNKEIPYGVQWKVEAVGTQQSATVNTYHGKKGFKIVVQGADADLKNKIEACYSSLVSATQNRKMTSYSDNMLQKDFLVSSIGCDESGKGDILGPLSVVAVYLSFEEAKEVAELGIRDSKTLSDKEIDILAEKIILRLSDCYEARVLMPAEYNRLYAEYSAKNLNLNHLLADLHLLNIEKLHNKFPDVPIILDQFGPEGLMNERVRHMSDVNFTQLPRAEQYISVAAASVIARYLFLQGMHELENRARIFLPKGASHLVRQAISELVRNYGKEILPEFGKMHFKTFDPYR